MLKSSYKLIIILLFISSAVFSQKETGTIKNEEITLQLFGIAVQPVGDFAKDIAHNTGMTRRNGFYIGDNIGLAKFGYGLGFELNIPVWFKGLNWIFSGKILQNGVNSSVIDDKFISELGNSNTTEFEYDPWINIPIMNGIKYNFELTNTFMLYGSLQAGINFSKGLSKKVTVNGVIAEKADFDFAQNLGIEIALGFVVNEYINLGVHYLDFNTFNFDGVKTFSKSVFKEVVFEKNNKVYGEKRSVSTIIFTIGYQFAL